jgi:peroxiredoxin
VVIGVSIDDSAAPARAFVEKLHLNYPVVMGDAKLGERYGGVLGVPVTFLIDRAGVVRARFDGEEHLAAEERLVRGLLGGSGR